MPPRGRPTLSANTCTSPPMMLALGSPSGASLQLTTGLPLVFRLPRSLLPRLPPVRLYVHYVFIVAHPPCREQALYPSYYSSLSSARARALVLSLFRTHVCMAIEAAQVPSPLPVVHSSPLLRAPLSFFSVMVSVSAGSVQAITGAILSYSSSASAPNLDPIAFKEAALARLRNAGLCLF